MPTTTTGIATEFIQFTRASNATVTDSDGRVKWAPHNLLTNSESFDAAAWTKTNIVTTGSWVNTLAAPNGTTTADLLRPSTVSTTHHAISGNLSSNATVTYAVYAYAGGYTKFGIRESGSSGAYASFDLTGSGSVLASASAGSVTMSNPQITPIGGGWFRASVTFVVPSGISDQLGIWVLPDSYTTGDPAGTNWSGDGTKGIYVWGAHVYRSDLGGMQLNTSAYPMYNPTTPKNLLGSTEDFSAAAWTKTGLLAFGSGSVSNVILAPNGLQTADKITENTATSGHFVVSTASVVSGTPYVFSVYAKAAEREFVMLQSNFVNNAYGTVNLLTGATNLIGGTGTLNAVSVGNGWWRVSLTATSSSTGSGTFNLYTATNATTFSYTGDGTSGIYLWGAQLSDSASLDSYVPVYGAAVTSAAYYGPRRDFNGATLACKGLLVEEQRSNLLLYSSDFDITAWSLFGTTRAVVSDVSPAGTSSIKLAVSNTSTSAKVIYATTSVSVTAISYTSSVYAKAAELSWIYLRCDNDGGAEFGCYFNVATGAKGTEDSGVVGTITPVGNSWYRCTVTRTMTAGTSRGVVQVASADGVKSFAGTIGQGVLLYGAQLEANASFATSYIPVGSTTAGATRNADVASVSTQAFPYSSTAGSFVVNFRAIGVRAGTNPRVIGTNHAIDAAPIATGNETGVSTWNGAAALGTASPNVTLSSVKVAYAHDAAGQSLCAAAGTVASNANTFPLFTSMNIGAGLNTSTTTCGWIQQITYLPRRLTSTELQTRTA